MTLNGSAIAFTSAFETASGNCQEGDRKGVGHCCGIGTGPENVEEDATPDRLRQLSQAKAELAADLDKYSPEHPDVLRLKREVERLQKAVDADANAGLEKTKKGHADNPVYIQVKGELDSLAVEREGAVKKRDELQAKLDK